MIGSTLTEQGRNKLRSLLQRNLDVFAWKPADMTGVPRYIVEHRLNVRKGRSPVRQKKRGQAADRNQAIQEEVGKLVEAGIMREVHYHAWLSNTVMLNPKKCTFGIEEGMFLGYKVSTRGLKVCPDKVDIVLSLPSPKCLKDVQRLNGKLASLNRFLAKSAEKSLPFFKTLKKSTRKSDFHWTTEVEEAFKQMKQLISELPMLVAPMENKELIVYLAAAKETVSAVLMTEREAKQMPIYFVSRALRGPKVNYTSMEKLVLALVHASKRLKRPRVSVKGQILADFIVERPEEESPDTLIGEEEELLKPWILFTDGSSCTDGSGAGLILTNPEGMKFTYALRFRFDAKNNEAEYEALIVPRSENKKADALSKITSTSFAHLSKQVLVEELKERSISAMEVLAVVEEERDTWMTPIFKYLMDGTLLIEVKKREHMHAGIRSVVAKALRIGYYWPTIHEDARKLIRACQDCQVHKPLPRSPQQNLSPIMSPWPFYKWGVDIAGPFSKGPGKVKFLIVAIDYFAKWIEAKPVATITGNQIKKFVWDNIDWCEKLCIRQHFASVKHPQTNSLVERANGSLGEGIKARLDERSKNWMEELPHVLWAHSTMIKSSNGDTSFSLTYGTEAVIPAKIGMPILRTMEVDLVQNNEALEINLDLLEERRERAVIQEARSKAKMERHYNSKVRSTSFKPGDLVYRNNDASRTEDTGKLGPKWKGPYEVTEALRKGAYKLRDRDGKQLPRTWNISNLKKCYVHKM
ncbi:reverse transcriptase domain-containing protein [Tanacetum coccineum]|uniref:Reverse transcriptase domain-containing protein n=1 Tax=Tanacetum coccineum TaxID=301880 RepID=A0ABQ5I228_9ASTR